MSLFFKNYSLVEVTYLLNRFHKTNSKNIEKNGVIGQNTHTHTTHRKITLERLN